MASKRNNERYLDLTAYYAMKNIENEERRNQPMPDMTPNQFMRGDVWYVEKYSSSGSEQEAGRPAVIVSNDMNNQFSTVVEVVYLTTQPKKDLPTHVTIRSLGKPSVALCEQITAVYTDRIAKYKGHLTDAEMAQIDIAMKVCLALDANVDHAAITPDKTSNETVDGLNQLVDSLSRDKDDLVEKNSALKADLDRATDNLMEMQLEHEKLSQRFEDLTKRAADMATELAKYKNTEQPYPAWKEHLRKAETNAVAANAKLALMKELYNELVIAMTAKEV